MLQYIIKHLKEGDHIYVETQNDTLAGQFEQVTADRLVLKNDTEPITLFENDILGIKYYESCNVASPSPASPTHPS